MNPLPVSWRGSVLLFPFRTGVQKEEKEEKEEIQKRETFFVFVFVFIYVLYMEDSNTIPFFLIKIDWICFL